MFNAGSQIDSQILYERLQASNRDATRIPAPIIIAMGLRTPDNIASVLRLADAAYSIRVIFVSNIKDNIEFDKKIQRMSRDTDKNITIEQYNIESFLALCSELPVMIAIEITTQSVDVFDSTLPNECCLVIGNESHGVDQQVLDRCQSAVHIPMYGNNGSMNVTHALAISLFEWRRQRQ